MPGSSLLRGKLLPLLQIYWWHSWKFAVCDCDFGLQALVSSFESCIHWPSPNSAKSGTAEPLWQSQTWHSCTYSLLLYQPHSLGHVAIHNNGLDISSSLPWWVYIQWPLKHEMLKPLVILSPREHAGWLWIFYTWGHSLFSGLKLLTQVGQTLSLIIYVLSGQSDNSYESSEVTVVSCWVQPNCSAKCSSPCIIGQGTPHPIF